jgi:hypothetical protein
MLVNKICLKVHKNNLNLYKIFSSKVYQAKALKKLENFSIYYLQMFVLLPSKITLGFNNKNK